MPLRILLIEDYQVDRWLICHALRQVRLAVDVHEATDGATGLRMLQQEAFDCVLLDYWLSDMDGLEFLAQLPTDEASPRVPIVMLTGESSPSIAVEAMKYGVQDYLVKDDLQPAALEQALTRAMAVVAESREQQQAYIDLERQVQEHTTALSHTSKQLELSRCQLRELANRMLSVQEEDRKRIARELHDELGQALTALILDLTSIHQQLAPEQAPVLHKIDRMINLTDQTLDTLGRIVIALRPRVLDDLGLEAAVEWQVQEFQRRAGLACTLRVEPIPLPLDAGCATAVFRILQEALTNVARHANATAFAVHLRTEGTTLCLDVQDNGRGISDTACRNPHSFGILGMYERVLPWGGDVQLCGTPGRGTVVTVRLPLTTVDTSDLQETADAAYSYS